MFKPSSWQYQNSEENAGAYPANEETGYWENENTFIKNTIGRFGCFFADFVNIGNTIRRQQQANLGIPSDAKLDISVAKLARNKEYFTFNLSKYHIGTDFATHVPHAAKLLKDMTGLSPNISWIDTMQDAQNMLIDYSKSFSKGCFFIAKVKSARSGEFHFITVTGVGQRGKLQVYDPYLRKNVNVEYYIRDVVAGCVITIGE